MRYSNKLIIILVILSSIILSSVIISNIFALEDSSSNNLLEKKPYTDSNFGYSFYYPANFILRKSWVAGELSLSNYDPSMASGYGFNGNQFKISIYIYEKPEGLSLRDWFFKSPSDPDFPVKINSITDTVINEFQGIRTNTTGYFGITSESVYLPINDHKILHISVLPATPSTIGIFDEILNSFNNSDSITNNFKTSILSIISPKIAHAGDLTLPFYLQPVINSYFDHNLPNYSNDATTTIFNGKVGLRMNGICWSWPPKSPRFFAYTTGLNNTGECLYYNGHDGIDFNAGYGDRIIAAADGRVTFAGCSNFPYCDQDLGRYVKIWHPSLGYSTIYGHLLDIATSTIYAGAPVTRGQLLGWSDHSGAASGDHLHFAVRNAQTSGQVIDPYGWKGQPGLDPWPYNRGYLWTTDPPSLRPPATYVSGVISQNTTWTAAKSPYVIQGGVTVNPGVTLTVEPGTIVKFDSGASISISASSTLNASGLLRAKIYFTSIKDDSIGGDTNGDGNATSPAPWDHQGINFNPYTKGNLANIVFRYGGSVFSYGDVVIRDSSFDKNGINSIQQSGGILNLISSTVRSASCGLTACYGIGSTGGKLLLTGNAFEAIFLAPQVDLFASNNQFLSGVKGYIMDYGSLYEFATWRGNDFPYIVRLVGIYPGGVLNIEAGTIIKFLKTNWANFYVSGGTLNAQGTAFNKVYFTSLQDDSVGGDTNGDGNSTSPRPGDFPGFAFNRSALSNLTYSVIRYGGNGWNGPTALVTNLGANVFMNLIEVSHSFLYGIKHAFGTTTIINNSIKNNNSFGVYNTSTTTTVNAVNNYWGDSSGPYHPTQNPTGRGDRVSDNVNFQPWLTYDPTQPPAQPCPGC